MTLQVFGKISDVETIAEGSGIRERQRLVRQYGRGNWKKKKGIAEVQITDGTRARVELHWYEAHGIGKHEFKIKYIIEMLS